MDDNELSDRMMDLLEDVSNRFNLCIGKCSLVDVLTASAYRLACHDLAGIEDEFGVSIAPTEVERSAMNTPAKIIAQVQKRL